MTDNKSPGRVITTPAGLSGLMRSIMRVMASGSSSVTLIADRVSSPRGNVHRALRSLVKRGFVCYDGASRQYFLTASGKVSVLGDEVITNPSEGSSGDNKLLSIDNKPAAAARSLSLKRGHNLVVKFDVLGAPKGWRESPKEFFRSRHVEVSDLGLRNVDGVSFTMDDLFFRVTAKSIVMTAKQAQYVGDVPSLMRWLVPLSFGVKESLERRYPMLRLSESPRIILGEIAHEGDPVAALKASAGFVVIKHSDGRARVQFDRSKGPVELEFLHPGMFDSDSETWERRILQLLDSPYDYDVMGVKVEEAASRIEDQDRRISRIIDATERISINQGVFDANMASHLDVLNSIKREIANFAETVRASARPGRAGLRRRNWR